MTESEIKSMAIDLAEKQGFKVKRVTTCACFELETQNEIIEISTTTNAKATVCINRFKKDGLFRIPTAHELIKIGCRQTTAEKKINQII